jgi:hypothetical protein
LPKVVIPGAVTSIGSGAFFECSSLTNAALPGSLTNIGDYSFSFCPLGNIQIPTNLSTIGPWAFESCAVTNLVIPPNVTSISNGAFDESTGLQSVTIFGSGIAIAPDAFFGCESLTNLFFAGNAPILAPSVFAYDSNVTAYYLDGTTGWGEFTDSSGVPAVLWNPVIQAVGGQFGIEGNQFGFDITGTTNIPIVVEACTNLANPFWIPLQSLTLTNGIFYFAEPFQSNNPSRFYRISSP